jgi:hypothetical protein
MIRHDKRNQSFPTDRSTSLKPASGNLVLRNSRFFHFDGGNSTGFGTNTFPPSAAAAALAVDAEETLPNDAVVEEEPDSGSANE